MSITLLRNNVFEVKDRILQMGIGTKDVSRLMYDLSFVLIMLNQREKYGDPKS